MKGDALPLSECPIFTNQLSNVDTTLSQFTSFNSGYDKPIENTYYTITEIANMVGYTNSLYFSRLFHKYIGMSPKEYRKVKLKENLRE